MSGAGQSATAQRSALSYLAVRLILGAVVCMYGAWVIVTVWGMALGGSQ